MREQTFPYDHRVLERFPGARAYERGDGTIIYLAERAGLPCLLIVPDAPQGAGWQESGRQGTPTVTVLEFEDEHERATHLISPDQITSTSA